MKCAAKGTNSLFRCLGIEAMTFFEQGQHPGGLLGRAIGTSRMQMANGDQGRPPEQSSTGSPVIQRGVLNILIVLDRSDPDLTALVCGLHSHTTLVCTGTQQAAQAIGDFAPDVVVVDLRLP